MTQVRVSIDQEDITAEMDLSLLGKFGRRLILVVKWPRNLTATRPLNHYRKSLWEFVCHIVLNRLVAGRALSATQRAVGAVGSSPARWDSVDREIVGVVGIWNYAACPVSLPAVATAGALTLGADYAGFLAAGTNGYRLA